MNGLVQVYTGDGKGKTTAALGLALRAIGWGYKVCFIQFIKARKTGEVKISQKELPRFSIHQFGKSAFIKRPNQKDKLLAQKALKFAQKIINSQKYQIVILDEINIALNFKLINLAQVIQIIRHKPASVEIVLTGRKAPRQIIEIADLVTEMKLIKHPFDKKIQARQGLDY